MGTQRYEIYVGDCVCHSPAGNVQGEFVAMLGEEYYCIRNYDQMPPFFMSIVSSSDHWLFISSTGGLSAGRANADSALFPYYTDDRITENSDNTGHVAILLVTRGARTCLWEPFSTRYAGLYRIERNLYKNRYGDKLVFEEINHDLALTYRYAWRTSDKYGFVVTAWLKNASVDSCNVDLVAGLQNLLLYGTTTAVQNTFSNLLNAYKRNELEPQTGLGIFALSSTLTDLAEPSESLKATTAWQVGLEKPCYLLSSLQLDHMRRGLPINPEMDVRGYRGAYLVHAAFELASGQEKEWSIVAEVNQDHGRIASLVNVLKQGAPVLKADLERDIARCSADLVVIVARADGLQTSGDRLSAAHHFSNVLFNTMRGGIFADNYRVGKADLLDFVGVRNRAVGRAQSAFFAGLPQEIGCGELLRRAAATGSPDVQRLCYEYLPLTFSRRHGDPSRPWNRFSINLRKPDGAPSLDYQGNWRDIFQNWEALAWAYPEFVESMVFKFVNATTADGYNPYRVTRDGIEWEVPNPHDPWANIGYWSDHQIVYLEKLFEISARFHPGRLQAMLGQRIFSHANVPYRLKPYAELLEEWSNTIRFDWELHRRIETSAQELGTDGRLVLGADGQVLHVNLAEKLLILLLAKLGNFVPEGGLWMNTQRPEWNDANNALVGKGLSVVTLCYLRRYIAFCRELLASYEPASVALTREVRQWFEAMHRILEKHKAALGASFSDERRRAVMDELGQASSDYRWDYYRNGLSGEFAELHKATLLPFLDLAQQIVEHALRANRRPDGLYHAYNVLHLGDVCHSERSTCHSEPSACHSERSEESPRASIGHLYEMLEGQVAILSSGLLSSEESLALLRSLRASRMYRADQHSYVLYPDRDLPSFLHKNCLSAEQVKGSALIARLVEQGDRTLITRDEDGVYHFNGNFRNARDVRQALAQLGQREPYARLVDAETDLILELYEAVFEHHSFTGRSGTFFAYEGLGSIYWHMVSKLLLAVQETFVRAIEQGESQATIRALADGYYDVRQGLGFNKTPGVYGAFPTDPYSHTPAGQGAKQPGMTGMVKEEVLTRLVEMGVCVEHGALSFKPVLLRAREFTDRATPFTYMDAGGREQTIHLPARALAYTFCQVPVVVLSSQEEKIEVGFTDGSLGAVMGNALDAEISQHIFGRDGRIRQLTVYTRAAF